MPTLKRTTVNFVKKAARRYKPLDYKFRKNSFYRLFSNFGRKIFRRVLAVKNKSAKLYVTRMVDTEIDPNLILLESYWGKRIACHPYAIYLALNRDPKNQHLRFVWVTTPSTAIPEDVAANQRVSFVTHGSDEYVLALLKAKYLLNNLTFPFYFLAREGQRYMNTWHGIPLKTLGLDADTKLMSSANTQRNYIQASDIITSGPFSSEKTVFSYGARSLTHSKIREIGSPRVDLTLNTDPKQIRTKLGLRPGKKVVLYAPTWRGRLGAVKNEVADQVATLRRLHSAFAADYDIVVSTHHLVRSHFTTLSKEFHFVPEGLDVNKLLPACDVLISDYSSIIFDFLVLDRPIILLTTDRVEYEAERGLYVRLEELPVTIVDNKDDLIKALYSAPSPSSFDSFSNAISTYLPHEDGNASSRAAQLLLSQPSARAASEKLKILIAPSGLQPNGITSAFISLLKHLDYEKLEVSVVVDAKSQDLNPMRREYLQQIPTNCNIILRCGELLREDKEEKAYRVAQSGTENPDLDGILETLFKRETLRTLGDHHFDVAIDYSGYSSYWSLFTAFTESKRKVIYQHNDMRAELDNVHKAHGQLLSVFRAYRLFDVVTAVSNGLKDLNAISLKQYYEDGINPVAVPNIIDVSEIRSRSREPIASPLAENLLRHEDFTKFINVARLSPEKNHTLLLRAFYQALQMGAKACLIIVGDGPLRSELEANVEQLNLVNHVIFTGHQPNPFPIMAASDYMILPSQYEGQGLVLLEALTLNVPCIGSNTPAIRSVIDQHGGTLVELNESEIAEVIVKFSNAPHETGIIFEAERYQREALLLFYHHVLGISANSPNLA